MNKKGLIFIIAGLLFIMAALALFVYNTIQSENAGTSSQRIVASLKEQIAKESESAAELPTDNPDRVMPALTVEGERYVGILSIPALDLTLPVGEWFSDDSIQVTPCLQRQYL